MMAGGNNSLERIELGSKKQLPVIIFCLAPLLLGFFILSEGYFHGCYDKM